jgi:hypothetical protein
MTTNNLPLETLEQLRQSAYTLRDSLLPLLRQYGESGPPEVLTFLLAVAIAAGMQADAVDVLGAVANRHNGQLCPHHDQGEVAIALHRAAQWVALITLRNNPDVDYKEVVEQ